MGVTECWGKAPGITPRSACMGPGVGSSWGSSVADHIPDMGWLEGNRLTGKRGVKGRPNPYNPYVEPLILSPDGLAHGEWRRLSCVRCMHASVLLRLLCPCRNHDSTMRQRVALPHFRWTLRSQNEGSGMSPGHVKARQAGCKPANSMADTGGGMQYMLTRDLGAHTSAMVSLVRRSNILLRTSKGPQKSQSEASVTAN